MEFINKKKITKMALEKNFITFIIYVSALNALLKLAKMKIYLDPEAEIDFLLIKQVIILEKYFDLPIFF